MGECEPLKCQHGLQESRANRASLKRMDWPTPTMYIG